MESSHAVLIAGVLVPRILLTAKKLKRKLVNGKWELSTKSGAVIARFDTLGEMQAWWGKFLSSPERREAQRQMSDGRSRGEDRTFPVREDPLMPFNSKYGLPDYDAT